jgi:hypothetical protein
MSEPKVVDFVPKFPGGQPLDGILSQNPCVGSIPEEEPVSEPARDFAADLELCEAAPAGPWFDGGLDNFTPDEFTPVRVIQSPTDTLLAEIGCDASTWAEARADKKAEAIAAFIAQAREGWPAALREIERLKLLIETQGKLAGDAIVKEFNGNEGSRPLYARDAISSAIRLYSHLLDQCKQQRKQIEAMESLLRRLVMISDYGIDCGDIAGLMMGAAADARKLLEGKAEARP